ncbi:helix-turn-helix domain-containing protein [Bradyrhizobium genosp. P]|uniref:helix-turn-helix domain-containing protein n=1 Tax=Bradyrhizobium genosp. P TaxID=83641 RepID=UPI003CE9A2E7
MSEPMSLSPQEAAEYIGLSKRQIYNLLTDGTIKGKRAGARTLIHGPSLRAYYASLPDYIPGASMPNAPHVLAGSRRRRRARPS